MPNILDFHVHEFSPLNSDAHCPVALTLNTEITEDPSYPENNYSISKPKLWNSDKSESFINNIDILKVAEIEMHLDRIQRKNNVSKGEIDNIVSEIGAWFESTAQETFGSIKKKKSPILSHGSMLNDFENAICTTEADGYIINIKLIITKIC